MMNNISHQLARYRLILLGLAFLVGGFSLWVLVELNEWEGQGWTEAIAGLITAGSVSILFELAAVSNRRNVEHEENLKDIRAAVFESLKLGRHADSMRQSLAKSEIDEVLESCLEVKLGGREVASAFMSRLNGMKSKQAKKRYRVRATVVRLPGSDWVDVKLEYKYYSQTDFDSVVLCGGISRSRQRNFPNELIYWTFNQDLTDKDVVDQSMFDVSYFKLDGQERPMVSSEQGSSRHITVDLGDLHRGQQALFHFELVLRRRYSAGTLYLDIAIPTFEVEMEFDVGNFEGWAGGSTLAFFGATTVSKFRRGRAFHIEAPGWVLPDSVAILTWNTDTRTSTESGAESDERA